MTNGRKWTPPCQRFNTFENVGLIFESLDRDDLHIAAYAEQIAGVDGMKHSDSFTGVWIDSSVVEFKRTGISKAIGILIGFPKQPTRWTPSVGDFASAINGGGQENRRPRRS